MAMQDFHAQRRLDRLVKDLEKIGEITVSKDMAILSLVGRNMRNAIGSAGMMFTSLAKAMINIEMISQGASEINISCGERDSVLSTYEPCPIHRNYQRVLFLRLQRITFSPIAPFVRRGLLLIRTCAVIEDKDAIKALNVIHESCLSPRSFITV